MATTERVSHEVIIAAIEGFEARKARIDVEIADLRRHLADASYTPATNGHKPKRRLSEEAKQAIGEATRRRWAKYRAEKAGPLPKRKMKAGTRAKLLENLAKARAARANGHAAAAARAERPKRKLSVAQRKAMIANIAKGRAALAKKHAAAS